MVQLTFSKVGNMNVCSFVPSEAGVLIVNRADSGIIRISINTDNTDSVVVDTDSVKDYALGINYTGITVKIESEVEVVKAEFSGSVVTPNNE